MPVPRCQLQMLWPVGALPVAPPVPPGYRLRCWREGEDAAHARLMRAAGFSDWQSSSLAAIWLSRILPDGFMVIEHDGGGVLVATAMSTHQPAPEHPHGGELGWVAADPAHGGRGLGMVVCAAATRRFVAAGYTRIYLRTDDHRLPAIRTYLKLGWRPRAADEDQRQRWREVCARLSWPCDPIEESV